MKLNNFWLNIWFVLVDLSASSPVFINNTKALPREPPLTYVPTHLSASTYPSLSCGLIAPTAESWKQYLPYINDFAAKHWNDYAWGGGSISFPEYLRNTLAPDLAPSSVYCDTVGNCGLNSCQYINPRLSQHDRQMAYFLFEQISGVDHGFKSIRYGLQEGASYADGQIPAIMQTYSAAPRIAKQLQQKLADRRKNEKLGMAIGSGLLLLAGSALGLPVLGLHETIVAPLVNLVGSAYVSIIGTINTARSEPAKITSDLEAIMHASLNEFRHSSVIGVTHEMKELMEGRRNSHGQSLLDFLQGEYFFRRDENIQEGIMKSIVKMFKYSVINAVWQWERSYIVDADAPLGGCQYDWHGPTENRACLSERPDRVYYLYALDVSREYDSHQNDKALIHGPTGYRNFMEGQNSDTYGATKEDIVRSSIFVHENGLYEALENGDYQTYQSALGLAMNAGKNFTNLMGAFTLPMARNPGGEAISSVWSKHGRNYPCMVGEFGWNDGTYSYEKDETFNFLERTGLMFSEDWEDFCHDEGHCKGDNDIDWHYAFEVLRKPGDPPIPDDLKHPFFKCKQKTKHEPGEPWHDFEADPPLGRDVSQMRGASFANATLSYA
jgi:hypothetical protein